MSCEINEGRLKVNSHVNQKNKIGFLLRTTLNNESYFIPGNDMKVTKLEIKGKEFWRITFDNGQGFSFMINLTIENEIFFLSTFHLELLSF